MKAEHRLAQDLMETHAARAAIGLERMPEARAAAVLRAVPVRAAALTLREMASPDAAGCLGLMAPDEAATIVEAMTLDDAAALLRAARPAHRDPLLAALPPAKRDPLSRVLAYPDGTAGAVMDPSIFQLPDDVLVGDARVRLRHAARDLLYYVYVVDRAHRLVGVLDIPELMLARPRDPVSTAMHRGAESLSARMPVSLVREHAGWHRYHALPVVDDDGRLLGAIRYQTLRRLEREAAERGPDPSLLTARALGELFQLGTTGLVAGVTARSAAGPTGDPQPSRDRSPDAGVPDA